MTIVARAILTHDACARRFCWTFTGKTRWFNTKDRQRPPPERSLALSTDLVIETGADCSIEWAARSQPTGVVGLETDIHSQADVSQSKSPFRSSSDVNPLDRACLPASRFRWSLCVRF